MLALNFLCEYYIQISQGNLLYAFGLFQFSFFLVKLVNHYEFHAIFQDIEHQLQENILHHFLHYSFFNETFIKLRGIFYPLEVIY